MRYWESGATDEGSLHCLGNGRLCAFEQGPEVVQIFGPPYSTSSFLQLRIKPGQAIQCESEREPGAAIWTHRLSAGGAGVGRLTDYVDSKRPCFVREIELEVPLTLKLDVELDIRTVANTTRFPAQAPVAGLLFTAPAGRYMYNDYSVPFEVNIQFVALGNVEIEFAGIAGQWNVRLGAGKSTLLFVGGPDYPDVISHTEAMLAQPAPASLERTRAWWQAFTERRHDFTRLIPPGAPERERLLQVIDDTAVLLRVQQSEGGGLLGCHPIHLAYVRDQYGASRCLLRLGYLEEAWAILEDYWCIWNRRGRLNTAHGNGLDSVVHMHENDDVEITGYLIIQAFEYLRASGDEAALRRILPMLEWAWEAQKKHLAGDMLPFNGDETYVAGGILPREVLNDGSAETTLLFITGGERLLGWVDREGLWGEERVAKDLGLLVRVRENYRKNFVEDGRLLANSPARRALLKLPRFRHGVCEGCLRFGWNEKTETDRYLCPVCLGRVALPAAAPVRYCLQPVTLMPLYLGSPLFSREEVAALAGQILSDYKATGKLPSRPDGEVSVGYDYGLLLYTLAELGDPLAGEIYGRMLGLVDPAGAWVEYYRGERPAGMRCRAWEGGVNLEAALRHVAPEGAK